MNKKQTENLLLEIFKLCDKTVWLDDFKEFRDSFAKILKKHNFNLWKIYYGAKSEKAWSDKFPKACHSHVQAFQRNKKRAKDTKHVYIKGRALRIDYNAKD